MAISEDSQRHPVFVVCVKETLIQNPSMHGYIWVKTRVRLFIRKIWTDLKLGLQLVRNAEGAFQSNIYRLIVRDGKLWKILLKRS